tara:strand:- start:350 stop:670 length:321 start_codon:yes stop_codon:yes gene_type:complete
MDILLISILTAQILTLFFLILGFLRLANIIIQTSTQLIDTIGPISEITENIAGLPEDFDPFQHGIKQMILEFVQNKMVEAKNIPDLPIKNYSQGSDGKFVSKSTLD